MIELSVITRVAGVHASAVVGASGKRGQQQ